MQLPLKLDRIAPALLALAIGSAGVATPASAVVITTGDGTGNTTAPADDPGFASVGRMGSTGIYLGNSWVLTAAHVGAADIDFGGVTYLMVPGSAVQLDTLTEEPPVPSDLLLFRILDPPALPLLSIATTRPTLGESAVMIGNGNNRETTRTFWNGSWQEVSPPPPATYSGWKKGTGRTVRWGENVVTEIELETPFQGTLTHEFAMDFDDLVDEGQSVAGDSGGALFIKRGGDWELAGMLNFVQLFPDQPQDTAVIGTTSQAADLAMYQAQIEAIVTQTLPASSPATLAVLAVVLGLGGVAIHRAENRVA